MERMLKDAPPALLPRPADLVTVRINPETGHIVQGASPDAIYETFYADNLPPAETTFGGGNRSEGEVVEQLF